MSAYERKTKWCEKCHRSHALDHEHFSEAQHDPAETVIGAASAEELGNQTEEVIGVDVAKKERKKRKEKTSPEEEKRKIEAARRIGQRFATAPFTITAVVTGDKNWRSTLAQEEIEGLAEDWTAFAIAWGMETTGKIGSVIALSLGYAEVGGKVYGRIQELEAGKNQADI